MSASKPAPMLYEQIYSHTSTGHIRIYYMDGAPTTQAYRELASFCNFQADYRDMLGARAAEPAPGDVEYLSWRSTP